MQPVQVSTTRLWCDNKCLGIFLLIFPVSLLNKLHTGNLGNTYWLKHFILAGKNQAKVSQKCPVPVFDGLFLLLAVSMNDAIDMLDALRPSSPLYPVAAILLEP